MYRSSRIALLSAALLLAACQAQKPAEPEKTPEPEQAMDAMEHSSEHMTEQGITFVGKSNIINHQGHFEKYSVQLTRDTGSPEDLTKASLLVMIDMDSVKSDPGVEGHMKREDFFNVAAYPESTFKTTSIDAGASSGEYILNGDLTIKGVTKQVSIPAKVDGDMLEAHYDLPRKDFGVGNDSYGNKFLEEFVPLDIHVELN